VISAMLGSCWGLQEGAEERESERDERECASGDGVGPHLARTLRGSQQPSLRPLSRCRFLRSAPLYLGLSLAVMCSK
jgi:hypothetical protein